MSIFKPCSSIAEPNSGLNAVQEDARFHNPWQHNKWWLCHVRLGCSAPMCCHQTWMHAAMQLSFEWLFQLGSCKTEEAANVTWFCARLGGVERVKISLEAALPCQAYRVQIANPVQMVPV